MMMSSARAVFVVAMLGYVNADPATQTDYTRCECYDYNIHCGEETWDDAKVICENEGGWLATIDTEELWNTITATVLQNAQLNTASCHNKGFWIGYNDENRDAVVTAHGEVDFTWLHPMCGSFAVWANNEPNDNTKKAADGQNCVQLWFRGNHNGKYDDEYCFREKGYVCQVPLNDCSCSES